MTPLRELAGARPRFLPDGRSLVAEDSFRIWMYDLVRGGTRVPLSAAGLTFTPVPTPDGARIVTSTYEGGPAQLWSYAAGNWEDVLRLAPSPRRRYATSFTADGKTMTFGEEGGESQRDIWILQGDSARPFLRSSASEYHARLSPDGRWLAYTSDQGTRPEVYLQAFPAGGRAVRVSVAGGSEPVWHPDRSELFFRNGDTIYSSTITGSMTPAASEPEFVVRIDGLSRGDAISFAYDVSSDGRQFVAVKEPPKLHDRQLHVVLNARTAQGSAGR